MKASKFKKSTEKIRNKTRIERVFKLVRFLSEFRTVSDCATHIEVHRKSIHRYFNLLSQLGFQIEVLKNYRHQYRITNLQTYFSNGNEI